VVRALNWFGFAPDQQVVLHQAADTATALPTGHPVGVGEILSAYVERGLPATRKQVEALAATTPCPPERKALEAVLGDPAYEQEILLLVGGHPFWAKTLLVGVLLDDVGDEPVRHVRKGDGPHHLIHLFS
jgi:hypothetical protein